MTPATALSGTYTPTIALSGTLAGHDGDFVSSEFDDREFDSDEERLALAGTYTPTIALRGTV